MERRRFIQLIGASSTLVILEPYLTSCSSLIKNPQSDWLSQVSPIQRSSLSQFPKNYSGDNPQKPHSILWNNEGLFNESKISEKPEEVDVVIVGGGVSGLFSAYLLRDLKPIILEQAPQFGGNAKGQSWEKFDYSIGAAYFMDHDPESEIYKLFKQTGIYDLCRKKTVDDPVYFHDKIFTRFWDGETAPEAKNQFQKISEHLAKMEKDTPELPFPEIPCTTKENRRYVEKLDRISFRKYLEDIVGEPLHPHIATLVEHYCWSTLGATQDELSAAQGLNALASEFGAAHIAPGGNAKVAEHLLKLSIQSIPQNNFRVDSLVYDVRVENDKVLLTYIKNGKHFRIISKTAIMCCPKFVVKHVLQGMEPKRQSAINRMKYRGYLVANILLNKTNNKDFYDLYLLKDASVDPSDGERSEKKDKTTDLVNGNYAFSDSQHSVLTLYRALPYDNGRLELFAPDSYEKFRKEFEQELPDLVKTVGATMSDVVDLRIARWGHAMPVGSVGYIHKKIFDQIRRPFKKRVFFVEQDNWACPAIETCANEAIYFTSLVRKQV